MLLIIIIVVPDNDQDPRPLLHTPQQKRARAHNTNTQKTNFLWFLFSERMDGVLRLLIAGKEEAIREDKEEDHACPCVCVFDCLEMEQKKTIIMLLKIRQ